MRIDPELVIDFATIADEGSFTRAAQRLRVAQPWLSARLRKLEDMIGYKLLDRTTRSVSLTARGAEFLEAAREVARAAAAADRLAFQLGRKNRRVVRVGAAPYTKIIRRRRDLIEAFSQACPDVSLELETGWSVALLGHLDAGEIDLSFMMGKVDPERFESIVLTHYGLAITVAREHPLAASRSLSPAIAARFPVHVFTRSLNPVLWDTMYAPLVEAGADFVEVPDMAEGAPDTMRSPDAVAAFFDFGADDPGGPAIVRIPLDGPTAVPFQLLRKATQASCAGRDFWDLTRRSGLEQPCHAEPLSA